MPTESTDVSAISFKGICVMNFKYGKMYFKKSSYVCRFWSYCYICPMQLCTSSQMYICVSETVLIVSNFGSESKA